MADSKPQPVKFDLDPDSTPVYYADSYLIGSNQHAVTLSFAQALPTQSEQNIVARVALTREQAREFLKMLNDHIEKLEV
jgi:hypothetical protein